jgi:hypothetical protein
MSQTAFEEGKKHGSAGNTMLGNPHFRHKNPKEYHDWNNGWAIGWAIHKKNVKESKEKKMTDPLLKIYESSKANRKTDEEYFAEMCEAVKKAVGGDHIPDEVRKNIKPGFFTMDHVHNALSAPDLETSKKIAMGHIEAHPGAKPQSKAKAKAAILNARSNMHVAQAMTNMLLAHPSQGLKVIQPGNSASKD